MLSHEISKQNSINCCVVILYIVYPISLPSIVTDRYTLKQITQARDGSIYAFQLTNLITKPTFAFNLHKYMDRRPIVVTAC